MVFQCPRHTIVNVCPDCQRFSSPSAPSRVVQGGLAACQFWQTDVMHVPSFGGQKFVHCSIDLFSGFLVTTAHTGESAKDVCHHLLHAFVTMGWPQEIHTDNGPAYQSNSVAMFLQAWGVCHSFGIARNTSSQGVVERMNRTLKNLLAKQKRGNPGVAQQDELDFASFTLNFLNCPNDPFTLTAEECHFKSPKDRLKHLKVLYRQLPDTIV